MNNREAADRSNVLSSKAVATDLLMGFCGDKLDASRWNTLRDKVAAALDARDEEWAKAARELVFTATCLDCGGSGVLGVLNGKPIACESCGGHEDARGLGYSIDAGVVEKLNALAALVEGVGK